MIFQNKSFTCYLTWEPRSLMSFRVSMGYIDRCNEVYEVSFVL